VFRNLSDRQKKILVAVGGGGLLALIALLGRGRGGTAAAAAATDPTGGAAAPVGSTFADNGEAAAGLSSALTDQLGTSLGDVGGALAGVTAGQQQIIDALQQFPPAGQQPIGNAPSADEIAAAVGPAVAASLIDAGTIGRPAGATTAAATAARAVRSTKPGVFTQTTGTRAGRQYVVQKGERLYESKPGKGDWGKAANTRIPIPGQAKAAPKPKPKPKPKPAPRRPAPHPSRPPAHHAAPPPRRPPARHPTSRHR
jgi:LysM repeat protein